MKVRHEVRTNSRESVERAPTNLSSNDPQASGGREDSPGPLHRFLPLLFSVLNIGAFFSIWEILARTEVLNPLFFPAPTQIARSLYEGVQSGLVLSHLTASIKNFAIGMLMSSGIAIPLGFLLGANRYLRAIISPYMWALASLPTVALVPLVILILGFTDSMKIALVVLSALFPIAINCMAGVKTVDPTLLSAAQVFGAKRRHLYGKIVLPFTIPFVVSGLNQGMGQGLIGLVVAEMFATSPGLGYLLMQTQQSFNAPLLYGTLIMLIVIALAFVEGMRRLEMAVAPWRTDEVL